MNLARSVCVSEVSTCAIPSVGDGRDAHCCMFAAATVGSAGVQVRLPLATGIAVLLLTLVAI